MINFVSNLPQNLCSGGFSALNATAFSAIGALGAVNYAGPINPEAILSEKIISKGLRLAGARSDFYFYSQRRLEAIAAEVHSRCSNEAQLDCFHGFTPWILTRLKRPYVAWSDCTFIDYISIYHRPNQFRLKDVERIAHAEANWLRNADKVLFTSTWAAERAIAQYALDANQVEILGIFGQIEAPSQDSYAGGNEFAFIATNFEAKGGRTVLEAFKQVRIHHPEVSLVIIGDKPKDIPAESNVTFTGFLHKEIATEFQKYREILGSVRTVLHPTKSDIAPLTIIEAGYFGCPAISSRRFAIPELIDDGRTGLLLDDPSNVATVTAAMIWMLEHEDDYRKMRLAARNRMEQLHSKLRFEERLRSLIRDYVLNHRTHAG